MRFRLFPDARAYWIDGDQLRLTPPASVRAGQQSWDYAKVTADVPAYLAFLGEAVKAGLPRDEAQRITMQIGYPTL